MTLSDDAQQVQRCQTVGLLAIDHILGVVVHRSLCISVVNDGDGRLRLLADSDAGLNPSLPPVG